MSNQDLFTINGLSVELGRDRRTIQRKLHGVKPAKVEGRYQYYRLSEVEHLLTEQQSYTGQNKHNDNEDHGAGLARITANQFCIDAFISMLNRCQGNLDDANVNDLVCGFHAALKNEDHFMWCDTPDDFSKMMHWPCGRPFTRKGPPVTLPTWVVEKLTDKTKRKISFIEDEDA